ncbi:MAG TPA: heme-binding protein, partial [Mycobacterium sp.]|jgi:hemophore-related protein|nr:heme-binding protein [Mycobacterium sp.]
MLVSMRTGRRAVAGALGVGAFAGAMLFGAIPSAMADDPALNPPNCTAGDLAQVASGVSAGTSVYLFTHPDVNWFFTSLEGLPRDQVRTEVAKYMDDNPMVKADLTGIRQPLLDLKNRCGAAPAPAIP